MWVKIIKATDDSYEGILDNDPKSVTTLHDGDKIEFNKTNVLEIGDF